MTWWSKHRRVWVSRGRQLACLPRLAGVSGPAPPTSPDRRPSGKHGVKDLPPSSLDCSSRWCCSLPRPTMRKDVCRIERPFARTLNGQAPPRCSPLDSGFIQNNLGLARSPFVLRTFPPRAGATRRLSRRRASAVWLAFVGGVRSTLRIRDATATTLFVTGFRPRFARLPGLSAGTVGGTVCWPLRVAPPAARLPLFSCLLLRPLRGCADLSRRGDSSFSGRCSDDRRIGTWWLYYYICCESQV